MTTTTTDRDTNTAVVAGVDTHKDTHHVAVLAAGTGARLGDLQVPATPAGYEQLLGFVADAVNSITRPSAASLLRSDFASASTSRSAPPS